MNIELDPNNPIPLHIQLKDKLKSEILQGHITGKIPSEREFMNQCMVSRTTVREAISALVREGVLEKRHGIGTFVSLHPIKEEWLGNLRSYSHTIKKAGMRPGAKLISHGMQCVPENIAKRLNKKDLYMIERLRYADEQLIAIERKFFHPEIGLKLVQFNLDDANIYQILENHLGIIPWEAEEIITSSIPSKDDAKLLGISKTESVLVTERFASDAEGKIFEFVRTIFKADKYALHIKMSRQ